MIKKITLICFIACVLIFPAAAVEAKKSPTPPVQIGKYNYNGTILPVYDGCKSNASGRVPPVYPRGLLAEGISGAATAMVVVDEKGKVLHVGATASTHQEFAASTVAVVKKWKYHPLIDESGVPIVHALQITLTFKTAGN